MRGESTLREDDRGQSGVLGVALITALVVAGTVGIVALGTGVLADGRSDAQIESAEQAMTKLDATAALVALGRADTQRASISLQGVGENIDVDPEAGWMEVAIVKRSSGEQLNTVMNRTLGSIVYNNGDTEIAYQGGGVWKKVDGGSIMVSPPEFHYRGNTLTLPLITIESDDGSVASGNLVLKSTDTRNQTYPNPVLNGNFTNPLEPEKQVNVTVRSEYYGAWGRFFEQRTDGDVTYDHQNETVVVELVVPRSTIFDNPLIANPSGEQNLNGCGNIDCQRLRGKGDFELADDEIESEIGDCKDGDCINQSDSGEPTLSGGETYFFDSGLTNIDNFTVETHSGDVSLVVDGPVTLSNLKIEGEGTVRIYSRGKITIDKGYINADAANSPNQLIIYGHSEAVADEKKPDVLVQQNSNSAFKGLIYAPGSYVKVEGTTEFQGSIISYSMDVSGASSQTYAFSGSYELDLKNPGIAYINYLYVSSVRLQVNGTA